MYPFIADKSKWIKLILLNRHDRRTSGAVSHAPNAIKPDRQKEDQDQPCENGLCLRLRGQTKLRD